MYAYIAQKSLEPVFNLDTNYFKPNRLKNFHYCQIRKGYVIILQHKSLYVSLLLIFSLSEYYFWPQTVVNGSNAR